jgi:hypothetical protein
MAYSIIQPPFTLKFREMPKRELEAYREWFHAVIPERIVELTKVVNATPGFQGWKPDETPESLDPLGTWFDGQVEVRKKTAEEFQETTSQLMFPIDVPDEELTNRTFSLAMDVGMYFGQVVLKNLPGTRWDQILKNKKDADYGQPVLTGFGAATLNPVWIVVTTAYGVSRKKPARLRQLYETWAKMKR